jgi:hypothetical protein
MPNITPEREREILVQLHEFNIQRLEAGASKKNAKAEMAKRQLELLREGIDELGGIDVKQVMCW